MSTPPILIRNTLWVVLASICWTALSACQDRAGLHVPTNADKSEVSALNTIRKDIKRISWKDGHVDSLDLSMSALNQPMCRVLAEFSELGELDLSGCHVDVECYGYISQLNNLVGLSLACQELSEPSLDAIGSLDSLRTLDLRNTRLPKSGIGHLVHLKDLQRLFLDGSNVLKDDVEYLRRQLPDCIIQL